MRKFTKPEGSKTLHLPTHFLHGENEVSQWSQMKEPQILGPRGGNRNKAKRFQKAGNAEGRGQWQVTRHLLPSLTESQFGM